MLNVGCVMFRRLGTLVFSACVFVACASAEGAGKRQAMPEEDVRYLTAAMDLARTTKTHFIFAEEMRTDALGAFSVFEKAADLIVMADEVQNGDENFSVFEAEANEERAALRTAVEAFVVELDELREVISAFPDSARPDALALIDRVETFREEAVSNAESVLDLITLYAQSGPDVLDGDADRLLRDRMRPFLFEYSDIVAAAYAYEQARIVDITGAGDRPLMFGTQAEYVDFLRWQSESFADILRSAFSQPCEDGVRPVLSGLANGFPGEIDIKRVVTGLDKTATGFGLLAMSANGQLTNSFQLYRKQIAFVQTAKNAIEAHEEMRLAGYEEFFIMIQSPEFSVCDLPAEDPFSVDLYQGLIETVFPYELNVERAKFRLEYYESAFNYYRAQLGIPAGAE